MNLSDLSCIELQDLLNRIPKEIGRRQKEEKAKLLKELEAKAAEFGFTLKELVSQHDRKERKPIAVKYRHPGNADLTWSGRGRQPRWMVDYLNEGGTFVELKV